MIAQMEVAAKPTDLEQGKWLYRNGIDIACCTSEAMRAGWRLAEAEFVTWYSSQNGQAEEIVGMYEFEHRHEW